MKVLVPLLLLFLVSLSQAEGVKVPFLKIAGKEYRDATITADGRLKVKILHSAGVVRIPAISIPEEILKELGLTATPSDEPEGEVIASKRTKEELRKDFSDAVKLNKWDKTQRILVVQSVDIGKLVKVDLSDELVFLVGDSEKRADDSTFHCIAEDTGRTFSYKTVLGASKTVRMFTAYKPITFDGFIKRLKGGDTIKIREISYPLLCSVCEGRPRKCKTCESSGLIEVKKTVVARWE